VQEQLHDPFMAGTKVGGQRGTQRRHRMEERPLRLVEGFRQEFPATLAAEEHGILSVAGEGDVPLP